MLQQILSKLEESYFTFLTPTGFGAVFLAIFSVTRPGDEIIVADPVYSPTRLLSQDFLKEFNIKTTFYCLLYTSPSPRDGLLSRMPSSA